MPASCFAVGILVARYATILVAWPLTVASLCVMAAVYLPNRRTWLLWASAVFFGWSNLTWRESVWHPEDLRALVGTHIEPVTVRGTLLEMPSMKAIPHDPEDIWRTTVQIEVEAIKLLRQDWQPARGRVITRTTGQLPAVFFSGQVVEIEGTMQPPPPPPVPGLFDYQSYLRWQGIYHQLNIRTPDGWRLAATNHALARLPFSERFLEWGRTSMGKGLPEEDESLRLQWAMVLGWKPGLNDEVSDAFMRTGTLHIFAISGLHVALIAAMLLAVFKVMYMPRWLRGWLVIPLIWFYTGVTGWQPSAIRSAIMATVLLAGYSLKRPSNLLNSLFAAGGIIVLWQPQQLFQVSFQLSFLAVLGIALFMPPLESWQKRLFQPDPLLPDDLRPAWQRALESPLRHLGTSLATSLAAFLGTLPIIAQYFHLVTPISLLANLVIVPLSSIALACGIATLFLTAWLPSAAELFNHSGWGLMKCMVEISRWLAECPGGWFYVTEPGLAFIAVFYVLLVLLLTGWLFHAPWRWRTGLPILLVALWLSWGGLVRPESIQARFTVLPFKSGHAVFYEGRNGRDQMLMDCGSHDVAEWMIKPFLFARGWDRLSALLLTHGDTRQVGGAMVIATNFFPARMYTSPVAFRSKAYQSVKQDLAACIPGQYELISGDTFGPFHVMHPEADDHFSRSDDSSFVLRAEMGGTRLLFLFELGRRGQSALLERHPPNDLQADIVVAGMLEDGEPLAGPLLDAIQPKIILLADSVFPASARASPNLRERLSKTGIPVLYGHEQGAFTITVTRNGWTVRTMRGLETSGTAGK